MCHWLARFACLLMLIVIVCLSAHRGIDAMQRQQTGNTAQTHLTAPTRRQPVLQISSRQQAEAERQQAEADLQLTAQVERAVVQRGSQYAYSLTINNLGPATATGVKLVSQLPVGMSYIIANPTQGSCFNSNGAITCNLGGLPVNSPASILIGVTITDRAPLGSTLTYTASVAGEQRDPQLDNNQINVATFVSGKATLAGRVTDGQGKALANVTLNVTGSATSARVTDAQGNFLFDELASGGNYTVTPASALLWFDPPSRNFPEFTTDQTANFVANACQYSAGPTVHSLPSGGGNASVTVTTTARCPWTASSQTPWITFPAGSNGGGGIGSGQLNFSAASTSSPRTGRCG